jgi:hypothetical protein
MDNTTSMSHIVLGPSLLLGCRAEIIHTFEAKLNNLHTFFEAKSTMSIPREKTLSNRNTETKKCAHFIYSLTTPCSLHIIKEVAKIKIKKASICDDIRNEYLRWRMKI